MKLFGHLYPLLPILKPSTALLLTAASLMIGPMTVHAGEPAGPALGFASGSEGKPVQDIDSAQTETASKKTDGPVEKADETSPKTKSAGEPLAPGMITLLQQEIVKALKKRNVDSKYNQFRSFAGSKLSSSVRSYTGSELAGNCRLKWYDHLLRNPLKAPAEAEQFTRELHLAAQGDHRGLDQVLAIAGKKLDLADRKPREFDTVDSPQQAIETVKRALTDCQLGYSQALAPLTKSEIRTLATNLYPVLTGENKVGHTLARRGTGRQLCNLLEKMNRKAMHRAAESLVPLADPQLLEQLGKITGDELIVVEGVTGKIVRLINTPAGGIIVGGREKNTYQLEKMPHVNVVIDLGGDDIYYEGTCSLRRPVMITIDLDGNDAYEATKPGVQGSAILGIAMLLDVAGNDVYRAKDVAQGACVGGAGILIDYAGDDVYLALRRAQGEALGGVGILIDRAGNDRYHAALWAQGMGGPLGFGLLDDLDGKDHYYCGGLYLNSYLDDKENRTPGYEGWGQGVGGGLRAVTNGGIGVILDGGGDDIYEADYLSHGGGYWCGVGFARDFGGNDQRLGATRKAYSGGARTQRRFVRFTNGFGVHYALGFLFDDEGNDTYNSTIMGVGFGWDCAVGYLCDFGGDDRYSGNEGVGAQASLGVLYDFDGKDVYLGTRQGRASSGISYHPMPRCGGNFSFVIDYGGTDKYGSGARNNSFTQRGSWGGFLIDRPKQEEINKTAEKPVHKSTKGS